MAPVKHVVAAKSVNFTRWWPVHAPVTGARTGSGRQQISYNGGMFLVITPMRMLNQLGLAQGGFVPQFKLGLSC
jgi:hypothetical protein